jgi:hypothetical protein
MLLAHLEYQLDNSILTQRTLRLRVGADDVAQACDRATRKLAPKVQANGFRKGRAPLEAVRRQFWSRIAAESFDELRRAAIDQSMQHLEPADKPFLPPEVVERDKVKLRYAEPLEFAVKYLIDPTGISASPRQPESAQGAAQPGSAIDHPALQAPGIPRGPALPQIPQ